LVVLGFPCNQFGSQEPGTDAEIKAFANSYHILDYGGIWFHKIDVNGANQIPLFAWLKAQSSNIPIMWNFEKFLLDRNGKFIKRYGTTSDPLTFENDIVALLK